MSVETKVNQYLPDKKVYSGYHDSREAEHKMLRRVLLVEDDFDDQFFAREELGRSEKVGKIVCFSNGKELIEYLQEHLADDKDFLEHTPTVIVLDLNMPLMNGIEALRELKSNCLLQKIPVIVVTGEQSQWEIEKAFNFKATAVFRKPLDVNKLRKFLEEERHWPWEGLWH